MLRHCHNSRNMKSLHFSTIYNSLFIALYISSFNSSSLSYVSFIIAVIILYSNSLSKKFSQFLNIHSIKEIMSTMLLPNAYCHQQSNEIDKHKKRDVWAYPQIPDTSHHFVYCKELLPIFRNPVLLMFPHHYIRLF